MKTSSQKPFLPKLAKYSAISVTALYLKKLMKLPKSSPISVFMEFQLMKHSPITSS